MGNYLPNSFYKDSRCISVNNNCTMKAIALPSQGKRAVRKQTTQGKRAVRKQSCTVRRLFSIVQLSAVVSKGSSPIDYKDNNNSFLLKTSWNKRSSLPFFLKAMPTANKSFEENSVDIYQTSHVETDPSSVRTNSRLSYQLLQFEGSTRCTPRTTETDILECKSNPCYISKQFIDQNSLFFTTFLSMVDTPQPAKNSTNEVSGTSTNPGLKHRPGISFFVDLDEPYKQCPLKEEYKFTFYNDCCSISDSFCSLESDDVSCCEEDFIVFEEVNECYQFHVAHSGIEHFGKEEYTSEDSMVCFKSETSTGFHCCISSMCSSTNFNQNNNSVPTIVWPNCEQTCETEFHEQVSKNPSKISKKVHFQTDEDLVVHHMKHWDFAYREARKGPWELAAADRCRFWRRIKDLESVISPCLQRKIEATKNL